MNQFDNEVSSTLKEIAERVETPPYLKDRIDKELLRRCPEYRKKIAVIFGGCSPEYSVSLQSAYAVISHMDTEVYTPVLIGISQSGDWFLYEGDIEKKPLAKNLSMYLPAFMVPNVFLQVESMPVTKNGKIDRKVLTAKYQEG